MKGSLVIIVDEKEEVIYNFYEEGELDRILASLIAQAKLEVKDV